MKKTITLSLASIVALSLMSFGVLSINGKAGRTTTGCTCHGAADATITQTLTFTPAIGTSYTPNTTYSVVLTVSKPGALCTGLDFKASLGTLAAGTNTKILGAGGFNEIVHNNPGYQTSTGSTTYNFSWTSPASGSVTFTYAGLVGDNNGVEDAADTYKLGTQTVTLSAVGVAEHAIVNNNLAVFPNPVSESAKISYELEANSTVSATLINVTGQVVATFFNKEEQVAGKQNRNLTIDPSIAKGIYFVAINVNGKNSYKKIVVE